jgi:hypothetical protein
MKNAAIAADVTAWQVVAPVTPKRPPDPAVTSDRLPHHTDATAR